MTQTEKIYTDHFNLSR